MINPHLASSIKISFYLEGSGFLGTKASLAADLNLIAQLLILIILTRGVLLARKKAFTFHGRYMSLASAIGLMGLLLVMAPSMLSAAGFIVSDPLHPGVLISLIHSIIGGYALISGIYFSANWRTKKSLKACAGNRRWMRITAVAWTLAALTGVWFYLYYYLPGGG